MSENKPLENDVIIRLEHLSKSFSGKKVLDDINLDIRRGEFVTFLGPSGCGKTTTLRTIAGFNAADEGRVIMDGEDISALPPHLRPLNTVFQRYALFPHLDVYDNIAFGLKLKGVDSEEIDRRVRKMLKLVSMTDYEDRDVESLSGGQQQRVAIARALVNYPKVLLLDEPLGALDAKLRKGMQIELKKIQKEVGITFVFVTHDQEEALSMSDTIVVINDGIIQQVGSPMDIYNEPEKRFVAEFIGESNIIEGNMIRDCLVKFDDIEWECVDKGFKPNEEIEVVLRPEDMDVVDVDQAKLTGTIVSKVFMGVHYEYFVETSYRKYKVHTTESYEVGKEIGLTIDPYDIQVMHIS